MDVIYGVVSFYLKLARKKELEILLKSTVHDDICYIYLTTTRVNNIQTVPGAIYRYSIMSFDNADESVTEIRQGKPDNYVVIWKKGNPLPAASEEMEAWYEMEREFDARFQETDELDLEEYNRKSEEIYATVPEWN